MYQALFVVQFNCFQYLFGIAIYVILQVCSITSVFPQGLNINIRGTSKYIARDSLALSEFDRRQFKI